MALGYSDRSLVTRRRIKVALSYVTGAGAAFLSVIAQDTHGTALLSLATSAGVLAGVSALSGYSGVHRPRTERRTSHLKIPSRSEPFVGRDEELQSVAAKLRLQEENSGALRVCVIHGMGGVGKTELAAHFAKSRWDETAALVWWLKASTYELLTSQLLELAAFLDVPGHESKSVVLNRLWSRLREEPDWLLVYDDVQDRSLGPLRSEREDLRPFLLPTDVSGSVVITTQVINVLEKYDIAAERVGLRQLGPEDGLALLQARIRARDDGADDAEDTRVLDELGSALGWLPLSLVQAGSYIDAEGVPARDYLRKLRERPSIGADADATIGLAIARVVDQEPRAEDLLRLCAFLAPEGIPRQLLRDPRFRPLVPPSLGMLLAEEHGFSKVTRLLSDRWLLSVSRSRQGDAGHYSMHLQIQRSVKEGMDDRARAMWSQTIVRIVEAAFAEGAGASSGQAADEIGRERLMPHVQAIRRDIEEDGAWAVDPRGDTAAREALARLMHQAGDYQEHRGVYQRDVLSYYAHEAWIRANGIGGDRERIESLLDVARQKYRLADLEAAEKECGSLKAECEAVLSSCPPGAERSGLLRLHAECLLLRADVLRERVKFAEAEQSVVEAMGLFQEGGLEWRGLDRARTEMRLGQIHRNAGHLSRALGHYDTAGALIPPEDGEEPAEHALFRAELVFCKGILEQDRGNLEAAEAHLRSALSRFPPNPDSDNFETAQVEKFLADVVRRRGETTRALARNTRSPLARLRLSRSAARQLHEADRLLSQAVDQHRKRREAENHKYAACLNKRGSLRLAQGRPKEAEQDLLEAEAIYVTAYKADHPYRAKTLARLGEVLLAAGPAGRKVTLATGDECDAKKVLDMAEHIFVSRLGPCHPVLVAVYERLARCTADEAAAAALRRRAAQVREATRSAEG
ncbi:NB-ARC domain-containing protein [Streptomyces humi]|uniref:NB-ARC domain-containing protein n=1 Tax=Streptomyces humi TaxID=1428620 RepID=UPI0006288C20|nr:NB-ARC domain-containing protein [Streptomyces humi]